jgi:5-methylcytosine-specific restriction enzyme subunit McrC
MTQQTIQLSEYESHQTVLDAVDRDYIRARFPSRIRTRQEVVEGQVLDIIEPGPNVGVLSLPSGRRLESHPKIDAANVFFMLSVAYELPQFIPETAEFQDLDHVLEFVVQHFVDQSEDRLRLGLYRNYIEKQENLTRLRGRIVFSRDLPLNFALRHRVFCEFAELSWDVPENQVIRQVAAQYSNWPFRRELRSQLADIDGVMADVSATSWTSAVFDRITYNRLNEDYRPLHHLSRLLMDCSSLDEQEGFADFPTFLIDMNKLFEAFLTAVLAAGLQAPLSSRAQARTHLDFGGRVEMRPDVMVEMDRHPSGIIDAKYKKLDNGEYKNSDLYQVVSYCVALRCQRGMLVYPRHLVGVDETIEVRNSAIGIRQISLPLDGSIGELKGHLAEFLHEIQAWATS